MTVDRRDEFRGDFWTQGRLLDTHQTRRFSPTERGVAEYEEERRAFVWFSPSRGSGMRQLVYAYPTPEECRDQVGRHNGDLLRRMGENHRRRAGQNIPVIGIDTGAGDFAAVLRNYNVMVNPRTGDIEWDTEATMQRLTVDPTGAATPPPSPAPPVEEPPVVLKRRMVLK